MYLSQTCKKSFIDKSYVIKINANVFYKLKCLINQAKILKLNNIFTIRDCSFFFIWDAILKPSPNTHHMILHLMRPFAALNLSSRLFKITPKALRQLIACIHCFSFINPFYVLNIQHFLFFRTYECQFETPDISVTLGLKVP